MTNVNAAKGARWESAVRDYLRELFPRSAVTRPRQEGFGDVGDIHLTPFIIQAKDVTSASLGAWIDAAEAQAGRAGERLSVVAWKRRKHGVSAGLVSMSLRNFREVAWRIREAERMLSQEAPEVYLRYVERFGEMKNT